MRKPLLVLLTAGGLFGVLATVSRGSALLATLLPMALSMALAVAVAARPSSVAIAAGALAALAGSVVWALSPPLGGAVVLALGYTERTLRVRAIRVRFIHAGVALAAGAAAGALAAGYAAAPPLYRSVSLVMCAVLSAAPLLVEAVDARVLFLEDAARRLGRCGGIAATLLDGADLLRCGDAALLDRETAANVKKSWSSLDRLVEARLAMLGGTARKGETAAMVAALVERQITEHIASLTRAYSAVTTIGAAEAGLDDTALRSVHARGEALDEQSRAIVEVGGTSRCGDHGSEA